MPALLDNKIKVLEVLPRSGDGGAFVKFSHGSESTTELERRLQTRLEENPIRPWFSPFHAVRADLVRGKPWCEDLNRLPNKFIRVEFVPKEPGLQAQELSPETLFSIFRRYGKLFEILPQPTDSKELPKYAQLIFHKARDAVAAKNCLHGYVVGHDDGGGDGTVLKISYQKVYKAWSAWNWMLNHPRIVIPIFVALAGTFTVAIFDPIRTFFIKTHITRTFHISDNRIYKWLSSQAARANAYLHFRMEDAGLKAIWDDRKSDIEQIQSWLMESADTFIVIQGPRGSGKRELVMDQALKGRPNTLLIDCKAIQEARGDSKTINAAATEVGYRPIFSWMNSISSLIDLAAQGTIGTKTGFSETLDTQLAKIWSNTGTALRQVALSARRKEDKDANLGDDEWLEAHPEKRPVVVIDNFLHKSQDNSVVYDKISEWAAHLTTTNIAHVVFLTTDVSFSKSLSKALPDRVFRLIALGDTSPEVAKRFVINHLDADSSDELRPSKKRADLAELDSCISVLGGRLTDLEFLARRIKAGESPQRAVAEIIDQSASEILKMYILDVDKARQWTPQQAWILIRGLAKNGSLRYNEILISDAFKSGGENTLQTLEQAELISLVSAHNGRLTAIKPGKPVYSAAFQQLTEDPVLAARFDLAVLGDLIKQETSGIAGFEEELKLLGQLPDGVPKQARERAQWLLGKLKAAQGRVEGYEREMGSLKKVLQEEF